MKTTKLILITFILALSIFLPLIAAAIETPFLSTPTVPKAAKEIVTVMDQQLAEYFTPQFTKSDLTIICTVPASLSNLNETSPLSRQMSEELSALLVNTGYTVSEIRKGNTLTIQPQTGELILTREVNALAENTATGIAVLAGTYTITEQNVRFNMSLIHIPTNKILAKASGTVPISKELYPLLSDKKPQPLMPSVQTKLGK